MEVSQFDRCYVYGGVVDLRKGSPGLSALIGQVDEDMLYVFSNRRRNQVKFLSVDKSGEEHFEQMSHFIRTARLARQFSLAEDTPPKELLEHLKLLNKGKLTNAAVLLFGMSPQRFLMSSEIKCAHFHGTEVAKPIPSYQVYKGTVFELVDQAVDFVLSKINRAIGTRAETVRAPTTYEIPNYTDNSSVQVMLFSDRWM